ncbi:MAG: hypothetical protein ACOC56_02580 [Atribacterota bacterium]
MGLFFYQIIVTCENCGFKNKLSVKKGISVSEFIKSNLCKCKECGVKINPKEYSTKYIE